MFVACLVCDAKGQREEGPIANSWKGTYHNSPLQSRTYFHHETDYNGPLQTGKTWRKYRSTGVWLWRRSSTYGNVSPLHLNKAPIVYFFWVLTVWGSPLYSVLWWKVLFRILPSINHFSPVSVVQLNGQIARSNCACKHTDWHFWACIFLCTRLLSTAPTSLIPTPNSVSPLSSPPLPRGLHKYHFIPRSRWHTAKGLR